MRQKIYLLASVLLLFAFFSCKKAVDNIPQKTISTTDSTKITPPDTTPKTPPVQPPITLPSGVVTTFYNNAPGWLIAMQTNQQSFATEFSNRNTVGADASGNVYVLFTYYGAIDIDPGTNVVVGGTLLTHATLAKYSPTGGLLWSKFFDSDGSTSAVKLIVDASGNVYCSLYCLGNLSYVKFDQYNYTVKHPRDAGLILKFSSSGTMEWINEISAETGLGTFRMSDIAVDQQGNVYATGTASAGLLVYGDQLTTLTCPNNENDYAYYVKYDANGKYLTAKLLLAVEGGTLMTVDQDQNIYISGSLSTLYITATKVIGTAEPGGGFINKYDKTGKWIWFYGSPYLSYSVMKPDASGNIYVAGSAANVNGSDLLYKIGADGTNLWSKTLQTNLGQGSPRTLSIGSSGQVLVCGDYNAEPGGATDLFHQALYCDKFNADGTLVYANKIPGTDPVGRPSVYDAAFDNAGNIDMIGFFIYNFKIFGTKNDPVNSTNDMYYSFFVAHFPDPK